MQFLPEQKESERAKGPMQEQRRSFVGLFFFFFCVWRGWGYRSQGYGLFYFYYRAFFVLVGNVMYNTIPIPIQLCGYSDRSRFASISVSKSSIHSNPKTAGKNSWQGGKESRTENDSVSA